jgi:trk system potassium uptake protein
MHARKTVLVLGLGRFGTTLVSSLWQSGSDVIVIDESETLVDDVKDRAASAFVGDATDPAVLSDLVAQNPDVAVVTFGERFQDAVLAVTTLKQLKVPEIVARAATDRMAQVLRAVGATRVVQIESEMGRRLASEIVLPVAHDLLDLAGTYDVVPWTATGGLVGKMLKDSGLRQRYGLNVIGVRRKAQDAVKNAKLEAVGPDTTIAKGDTLLLVGETRYIHAFLQDVED